MATSSSNSRRPVMAKNEPSAIAKLVKSMLAIILIVVASVGATLFLYDKISSNPTSVEASPDKPVPLPTPIFSPLEPFTVTLRGETSSRILYVAITLRVADEESRRMIMNYMPEVRDRILSRLAEQKPDYVQTVEGRSEEHTSELQSLMRISNAVFCLKTKTNKHDQI